MSFEELGRLLRQERERRGLSVEDVAERLKLMPRIVRAMEQADLEALPQAAYARGFVKAYGKKLLELDPELIDAAMEEAWPDDSGPASVPHDPVVEGAGGGKGRLAALLVLLLVLAAGGGFWLARDLDVRLPSGVLSQAEPAPSAKIDLPSPPAPVPRAKGLPAPASNEQAASRQAGAPSSPTPLARTQPDASSRVPADGLRTEPVPGTARQAAPVPPAPAPVSAAPAAPVAAPQDGPHNLIIIALAECWVHSNADNTDTRQFSLRKGDTFALTFGRKLVLKLGNAGGVRIRLDGRDLDPPGEAGQVKTLTFPDHP